MVDVNVTVRTQHTRGHVLEVLHCRMPAVVLFFGCLYFFELSVHSATPIINSQSSLRWPLVISFVCAFFLTQADRDTVNISINRIFCDVHFSYHVFIKSDFTGFHH